MKQVVGDLPGEADLLIAPLDPPCFSGRGSWRTTGHGNRLTDALHFFHFACGSQELGQSQERNKSCQALNNSLEVAPLKKNHRVWGEWDWEDRKKRTEALSENFRATDRNSSAFLRGKLYFLLSCPQALPHGAPRVAEPGAGLRADFSLWGNVEGHYVLRRGSL